MTSKKKMLSLVISALLTTAIAGYPAISYAQSDNSNSNSNSSASSGSGSSSTSSSDSDKRSSDSEDSGDKSIRKLTICHVPPGNPANKHTIHISYKAWPAHRDNHGGDYLGSCNREITTTTKKTDPITSKAVYITTGSTSSASSEVIHVIAGCTGDNREALLKKVQSYYEPITVEDSALDDESVVTAMSQCLDNGDSSDSNKGGADSSKKSDSGKKTGGQGQGRDSVSDSVSDSGNHHSVTHRIRGCQNKDSGHKADSSDSNKHGRSDSDKHDSNKNYHKKLKAADSEHDTKKGIKDPIVVSDSSLDDSGVWKEYKKCAADSNDSSKIDSDKIGPKKGDSGHKQHILKSCDNDSGLKEALKEYKEKEKSTVQGDILLTESSYNDVWVHNAVADCVTGGATDTPVMPDPGTDPGTGSSGGESNGSGGNGGSGGSEGSGGSGGSGVNGRLNWREITAPK